MNFCQKDFGARVRCRRMALHMTQQELSEKIHADTHHIGRIERGERAISVDLLLELSEALNVSTDYLLVGTNSNVSIQDQIASVIDQLTDVLQKMKKAEKMEKVAYEAT